MKKFFAIVVCGVMLLASSLCLAAVDAGKIALGGIYPGMPEGELLNVAGQPQYRNDDDWHYANFVVEVEHGIVEKVTTYNGAVSTPAGVHVGQAADILNSTYGSADKVDHDYNDVEYEYYSNDYKRKIEFKVVGGVIVKIECHLRN